MTFFWRVNLFRPHHLLVYLLSNTNFGHVGAGLCTWFRNMRVNSGPWAAAKRTGKQQAGGNFFFSKTLQVQHQQDLSKTWARPNQSILGQHCSYSSKIKIEYVKLKCFSFAISFQKVCSETLSSCSFTVCVGFFKVSSKTLTPVQTPSSEKFWLIE